jgi:hypothetical protein
MIDRDELSRVLSEWPEHNTFAEHDAVVEAILALEKPADGITLTAGAAGCAMAWLDIACMSGYVPDEADRMVIKQLRGKR